MMRDDGIWILYIRVLELQLCELRGQIHIFLLLPGQYGHVCIIMNPTLNTNIHTIILDTERKIPLSLMLW